MSIWADLKKAGKSIAATGVESAPATAATQETQLVDGVALQGSNAPAHEPSRPASQPGPRPPPQKKRRKIKKKKEEKPPPQAACTPRQNKPRFIPSVGDTLSSVQFGTGDFMQWYEGVVVDQAEMPAGTTLMDGSTARPDTGKLGGIHTIAQASNADADYRNAPSLTEQLDRTCDDHLEDEEVQKQHSMPPSRTLATGSSNQSDTFPTKMAATLSSGAVAAAAAAQATEATAAAAAMPERALAEWRCGSASTPPDSKLLAVGGCHHHTTA